MQNSSSLPVQSCQAAGNQLSCPFSPPTLSFSGQFKFFHKETMCVWFWGPSGAESCVSSLSGSGRRLPKAPHSPDEYYNPRNSEPTLGASGPVSLLKNNSSLCDSPRRMGMGREEADPTLQSICRPPRTLSSCLPACPPAPIRAAAVFPAAGNEITSVGEASLANRPVTKQDG